MYIYKIHHVARSVAKIRLFSHLTTKSWICFSILRNLFVLFSWKSGIKSVSLPWISGVIMVVLSWKNGNRYFRRLR